MAESSREKPKRDFRQEATDLLVDMLEKGTAPWQRPWDKNAAAQELQMPHNGVTGRAYTGGNALYLMSKGMQQGYNDPRWMTYDQASSKGWQVRKGEKATQIEFWQFDKTEKFKDPTTGQVREKNTKLDRPIQRLYSVFNAKQIDGVPAMAPQQREEWQAIEAAERALKNSGAKITHEGTAAFYQPSIDKITMPPKQAFPDQAAYYGTALHELAHWTGHESRLDRDGITGGHPFGSEGYAREELRAEMASVFMQSELGIPHDIDRHASYLDSWITALKKDKNELFRAAKEAGQAADYVLDLSRHKELDDTLADKLAEQALENVNARYGRLNSTAISEGQGERLLDAAVHRELEIIAESQLSNPEDRVKLMQRSAFAGAKDDKEKAQELDSALRELDYIENLPDHVVIARSNAKDKRIVELRDIEGLVYVDKQTGDLAIAAKSPEAIKDLIERSRAPDAVVLNDIKPNTNTWFFNNADGNANSLIAPVLGRLGVGEEQLQKVGKLLIAPEQQKEEIASSFKEIAQQAKEQLGLGAKTFPPQPAEGIYKGPIIAENEHHVLQQVSPLTTVAHKKIAFEQAPTVDKEQHVRIPYEDGKAKALPFTPARAKEKTRSLSR